jgi:hypothetical protein
MRRNQPPRFTGLHLEVPDGVTFEDRLTGEAVVRTRTERAVRLSSVKVLDMRRPPSRGL